MLWRDLWHLRGQVLAAALVVACGIAALVTMRSAYVSLEAAQAGYYAQYRFADVFAGLKRAPESLASEIRILPGVAQVRTRVVAEVTLDVPGLAEPASGRLVSIPEVRQPISMRRIRMRCWSARYSPRPTGSRLATSLARSSTDAGAS